MKQRQRNSKKDEKMLEFEEQVILYAIGSNNKPIPSETHLQTMMFLASKAYPELQKYFQFEPKKDDDEPTITNKSKRKRRSKRVRI